jgi:signal transduction histidine kinase
MGLGLAISYGIIRDYGGNHHIESAEGQGTTFTMHFPRADQAVNKE